MNALRTQVERFYDVLWNAHDRDAIPGVLHEDVTFRGSLGQSRRGHAGFADYVDGVHAALGDYRCTIVDLVVEPPRAFARMRFEGLHRAPFMGFAPTGLPVAWEGAALFTFAGDRIADVWVLGDLKGLERRLHDNAGRPAAPA